MAWELINGNPFKEIEKVRSEMDRLLDTFLFGKPQKGAFQEQGEWRPAVDVTETKGEIVVNAEISGVDPKDIEISLSEGILTVKGEKRQEAEEKEKGYHLLERSCGAFTRSIRLPAEVQSDKITASYRNGVLTIVLPKSEEAQKREIKIKVE
jgi:HSP20 family protein